MRKIVAGVIAIILLALGFGIGRLTSQSPEVTVLEQLSLAGCQYVGSDNGGQRGMFDIADCLKSSMRVHTNNGHIVAVTSLAGTTPFVRCQPPAAFERNLASMMVAYTTAVNTQGADFTVRLNRQKVQCYRN